MRILTYRFNWFFTFLLFVGTVSFAQDDSSKFHDKRVTSTVRFGTASYYSNKFIGRKTASGDIFSQKKMTAACNIFPLGTKVRVVNLKNNLSVIVKINDRLHVKNKRLIDLTATAAKKLQFTNSGLVKVKVEKLKK